ncbi:MAG: hypothetical protein ACQEUG_15885 [Pseudomonadota bacterium]
MQGIAELPTYTDTGREDLIALVQCLAFELAQERLGNGAAEARQRVRYHAAHAELLARTTAHDATAQRRIEQERAYHEARARAFQRELGQLGGGE